MRLVTLATLASTLLGASTASALTGGTLLSSRQERAGIFEIYTYDRTTLVGRCTATVLYSSVQTNKTWLVTAAHCFSYHDDLYYVFGHFAVPKASIHYDPDDIGSDGEAWTATGDSHVYRHPEWTSNGGHTAWFGPHDVAFIRLEMAIPMFDDTGRPIEEYRRPIYTGAPYSVSDPFVSSTLDAYATDAFCGQSDGQLRCDTLSNLWFSPSFRGQFFQLPRGAWHSAFFASGDSGGPLIKYAPGLSRRWVGRGDVTDAALHGVVLGVLQGPTVFCDYIQNGNCNPSDGLATRFEGIDPWLATLPSSNLIPRISTWGPFFTNFEVAVGQASDLASSGEMFYSFPAYAGAIVGMGIDKATNQLTTWYDNGTYSVGSATDLDLYSQAPPPPGGEVMPTRFYSSPKASSHIAAIMIGADRRVYAYYDDGTTSIGTAGDLDAIETRHAYAVATAMSPADLVAVAARPGGGVLAFYRDSTFSQGTLTDLDAYAPRSSFDTNGRDPEDILAIDSRADGKLVTLFAQPSL